MEYSHFDENELSIFAELSNGEEILIYFAGGVYAYDKHGQEKEICESKKQWHLARGRREMLSLIDIEELRKHATEAGDEEMLKTIKNFLKTH